MIQIAFGPCTQAISIPNGPFGIIALQDTDVILNPEFLFSTILPLFEKHELRPFHLLDQAVLAELAMAMGAVTVTTTSGDASPGDMPCQRITYVHYKGGEDWLKSLHETSALIGRRRRSLGWMKIHYDAFHVNYGCRIYNSITLQGLSCATINLV